MHATMARTRMVVKTVPLPPAFRSCCVTLITCLGFVRFDSREQLLAGRLPNPDVALLFRTHCAHASRASTAKPLPEGISRCIKTRSLLLDHLVRDRQRAGWNGDAKRIRGLQIDDQIEFCRRLHRHIGWLLASENPVHIARSAAVLIDRIGP